MRILLLPILSLLLNCFPYVYHDQKRVLVNGIDIDATLKIARIELEEGGFDATLTVWAMRDQVVTVDHANTVSELYFGYIDKIAAEKDETTAAFGVWHFAWAISNLYRNGDASIKAELEEAYRDACKRPESLEKFREVATEHVVGTRIYMGDTHDVARAYARSHIVAPGNAKYIQSLDQYLNNKEKEKKL